MLSTVDNPFNPWTDFDKWYDFDCLHGYNTVGLLARHATISDSIPESTNNALINLACNEIMKTNPEFYIKVFENDSNEFRKGIEDPSTLGDIELKDNRGGI